MGRAGFWLKVSVIVWSGGFVRDIVEGDSCVLFCDSSFYTGICLEFILSEREFGARFVVRRFALKCGIF